jgi:hypothetical protein
MEENLEVMVKEAIQDQSEEGEGQPETEGDVSFEVVEGELFEVIGKKKNIIANFYSVITSRSLLMDEEVIIDQLLDLKINFQDKVGVIRLTAKEFNSGNFIPKVWAEVGTGAILYGSKRTLVIATQEISGDDVPIRRVMTSHGFNADGHYLSSGIKITPEGFPPLENLEVDLSGGNFSKRIFFLNASAADIAAVANHIYQHFLNLKAHDVTYPLIGHACLAPFRSNGDEKTGASPGRSFGWWQNHVGIAGDVVIRRFSGPFYGLDFHG